MLHEAIDDSEERAPAESIDQGRGGESRPRKWTWDLAGTQWTDVGEDDRAERASEAKVKAVNLGATEQRKLAGGITRACAHAGLG